MVGEEYTPASLMKEIAKDLRYFVLGGEGADGQGGLTFSGGEPMLYPDFIAEFCAIAPDIHAAVETSGFADRISFEKVLDSIDLFLFDFKLADPREHEAWCGADNALILSNLDFLYKKGKEIILRLPLIPGINDSPEHARAVAALLEKYPKIRRAEILPYHTYGLGKQEELGMPAFPGVPAKAADPEHVGAWVGELRRLTGAEVVCL
jgi:pyruvate formate lyase activating enzyme